MIVLRSSVKYNEFFRLASKELKTLQEGKMIEGNYDFSENFYRMRRNILKDTTKTLDSIITDGQTTTELVHTVVGQTQTLEKIATLESVNFFQIWKMIRQWTWHILFQEVYLGYELTDFQSYFRRFLGIYLRAKE